MSELVSLIMPAWRPRADWLEAAVRSALDESACDVELIVVDDGNEEPVAGLLEGIDDSRLRMIRVEHCGPYAARNAAIAEARGTRVRFVDADDVVMPGSTGRLLAAATRDAGEVTAYGATLMCDEDLEPLATHTSQAEGPVAEACVLGEFDVYVVSLLYPRRVIERAGPWEPAFRVSGDWDYVLRTLEQAPVRRIDEVVTRYRRHGASVTRTADVAAAAEAGALVLNRYFARHPGQRGSDLERRAWFRLHMTRAHDHAFAGQRGAAVRQLLGATRRRPLATAGSVAWWAGGSIARAARRARRERRKRA